MSWSTSCKFNCDAQCTSAVFEARSSVRAPKLTVLCKIRERNLNTNSAWVAFDSLGNDFAYRYALPPAPQTTTIQLHPSYARPMGLSVGFLGDTGHKAYGVKGVHAVGLNQQACAFVHPTLLLAVSGQSSSQLGRSSPPAPPTAAHLALGRVDALQPRKWQGKRQSPSGAVASPRPME